MNLQSEYRLVLASVLLIACITAAPQRSPYAPGPVVYPEVLPQYTSPPSDVDQRFGSGSTTPTYVYVPTDAGSLLPVDNLNWIQNNWPQDKIPFNVANSQHLLNHRGGVPNTQQGVRTRGSTNTQQNSNLRGSFAGGSNNQQLNANGVQRRPV